MHGRTTDGEAFESIFRAHCMADSPASRQGLPSLLLGSQPSTRLVSSLVCHRPQTWKPAGEFAGKEVRRPSDQDGKGGEEAA